MCPEDEVILCWNGCFSLESDFDPASESSLSNLDRVFKKSLDCSCKLPTGRRERNPQSARVISSRRSFFLRQFPSAPSFSRLLQPCCSTPGQSRQMIQSPHCGVLGGVETRPQGSNVDKPRAPSKANFLFIYSFGAKLYQQLAALGAQDFSLLRHTLHRFAPNPKSLVHWFDTDLRVFVI